MIGRAPPGVPVNVRPLPALSADPLTAALHGPLAAAGLPAAWRGADVFVVLDVGFGAGLAFLAALRAWRDDPARAARLHWAATLERPLARDALRETLDALRVAPTDAEPLLARWPCAVGGVHRLPFHDARVMLSVAVGPTQITVPGWVPRADALLLSYEAGDAGDTARGRQRPFAAWRAAAACLATGALATVSAAPGEPACDALRMARDAGQRALESAGFEISPFCDATTPTGAGGSDDSIRPHCAVSAQPHVQPWLYSLAPVRARRIRGHALPSATTHGERPAGDRSILVVGGGLAGCATSHALARRGWSVLRLDAGAPRGSDQPVLAHHPSLTPDDAPLSRLTRAAMLLAHGLYDVGALRLHGRVQLADPARAHAVTAHLPRDWAEPVDAAGASARAGVRLRRGGWWLPMAGSADPEALCDAWTATGVLVRAGIAVATLVRRGDAWTALDSQARVVGEAPVVLLACGPGGPHIVDTPGASATALAAHFGPAGLRRRSGLTTVVTPHASQMPRCTVGGDGHAVPVDAGRLLLGSAGDDGDHDNDNDNDNDNGGGGGGGGELNTAISLSAGRAWARFASQLVDPGPTPLLAPGRRGERISTRDHLPLIGPVPDARALAALAGARRDDRRPLPVLPGLWIASAFGGRGLLWSVLAAELIAARLNGEPAPLDRGLAASLSADRFLRQALRRTDTSG